jgi:hypothetical protein
VSRSAIVPVLVLLSCLAQVRQGVAQGRDRPARPFQGLFGGADRSGSRDQSLDFTASLFGGYDGNVASEQGGLLGVGLGPLGPLPGPSPLGITPNGASELAGLSSGLYGVSTSLSYERRWRHSSLNAYGSGSVSEYPAISDSSRDAYSGGIGFTTPIGRRNTLHLSQSMTRVPYYSLSRLFPTLPPLGALDVDVTTPSFDFGLVPASAFRLFTNASVSRDLSRRSTLSLFYTRHGTIFDSSVTAYHDTSDSRAGMEYRRELTRNTSLRLGYAYRMGRYGLLQGDRPYSSHEVDAGVDYRRDFTFWRRTNFSFTTGSSILADQPVDSFGTRATGSARLFLTGSATLVREFRRSWSARAQYTRGLNYLDGFNAPLLSDAVTFGIGGLFARRVQAGLGGSYSTGRVGLRTQDQDRYSTWTGHSSLDIALSRHLACYVSYFYYHYDIQSAVVRPAGVPPQYDRQGFRAGLSVWMPLM